MARMWLGARSARSPKHGTGKPADAAGPGAPAGGEPGKPDEPGLREDAGDREPFWRRLRARRS